MASLYNDGGKQIELATKMVGLWYDEEVIKLFILLIFKKEFIALNISNILNVFLNSFPN